METVRLDAALVSRGYVSGRDRAKEAIQKGVVYVNGRVAVKASQLIESADQIEIRGEVCRYVSRGGLKLEKALEVFGICLAGKVCADAGASTGGFTDCMLQHGASKVYAIDSGRDQLHASLRSDIRVVAMERTDIRSVAPEDVGGGVDFLTADLSFIPLAYVMPCLYALLDTDGRAVVLVKPQFEAGRAALNKKGVVRDAKVHVDVLRSVLAQLQTAGFHAVGLDFSPIKGPEGNIEFLLYLAKQPIRTALPDLKELVRRAQQEAREHL